MEAINEIIFFASLAFLLGAVIADQWHRKARKENTARIDAICERVKLMTDHILAFPNVYDLTDQQKERMKQFIVDNPYLT